MMESEEPITDVMETLSQLAPGPADAPRPAAEALAQLRTRSRVRARSQRSSLRHCMAGLLSQSGKRHGHRPTINHQPSTINHQPSTLNSQPLIVTRRSNLMTKYKYTWATALVLLFFAAAFTFPGVRAAASDFLGVFRVQKFAPISISPRQLAMLEQLAGQGLYPGHFEVLQEPGPPQRVESPAAAAALLGQPVRTLTALGEPRNIMWAEGGSGRLTVELPQARALLNAAGLDPALLPDSLDGANIDVTLFENVTQEWDNGMVLLQTESPAVHYPADVDPAVIGEALLQLLGLSPGEARRLARTIDWTNTLLLPIPDDMATFGEVRVDGVTALAISSLQGHDSTIMWQKGGIVYVLYGSQSVDDLVKIANSLR
jgi:hypothetical protein